MATSDSDAHTVNTACYSAHNAMIMPMFAEYTQKSCFLLFFCWFLFVCFVVVCFVFCCFWFVCLLLFVVVFGRGVGWGCCLFVCFCFN